MSHTPSPIFLCGYPKSGTTLLVALLDHHPDLLVFPEESKFFTKIAGHPENQTPDFVLTQTGANTFRFGEVQRRSGYRNYTSIDFAEYEHMLKKYWEQSDKTPRALLESTVFSYGTITQQENKAYWVEKTPGNEYSLQQALNDWPDLRAIYILRDPRDNFCSYRKQVRHRSRELTYEGFILHWCRSLRAWEQFARHHPNALFIRYDDLVCYPRATMERVCAFLHIRWHDSLLYPTRNEVFWSGNSMHETKFEGISSDSVGKYHILLSPLEIRLLETWIGCIMMRYGWSPDYARCSARDMAAMFFARGFAHASFLPTLHMLRFLAPMYLPSLTS